MLLTESISSNPFYTALSHNISAAGIQMHINTHKVAQLNMNRNGGSLTFYQP